VSGNIQISGLAAQNVAIGDNSTIVNEGAGTIEQSNRYQLLGAPLADLQRAIEAFQGDPETRRQMLDAHREIAAELERPAPDKSRVLAVLDSLKRLAGSASAIVQAAATLALAAGPLL
jgi:hypothetical protein